MKNKPYSPDTQRKNHMYTFIPVITTVAFPLLFGGRKNEQSVQEKSPKLNRPKSKVLGITKYEVSDNKIKFFDAKGFPKKRWVLIEEILIQEISSVESFGNKLKITWNEEVYTFVFNKKFESVISLRDKIQSMLKEKQKTIENNKKSNLTKNDLTKVMGIIDLSFDILMGLNKKPIDWANLEGYASELLTCWKLYAEAPFKLDFANVSAAIKNQITEETSKEAYSSLKSIYEYFERLKPDDEQKDNSVNISNTKNLIIAYYLLNDVFAWKSYWRSE